MQTRLIHKTRQPISRNSEGVSKTVPHLCAHDACHDCDSYNADGICVDTGSPKRSVHHQAQPPRPHNIKPNVGTCRPKNGDTESLS